MTHIFHHGFRRALTAVVFVALIGALILPVRAGDRSCGDAFDACVGDALKVGVFSLNPKAGLLFGLGCIVGYEFCVRYYAPMK